MITVDDLQSSLLTLLPAEYHDRIPQLTRILGDASSGALSPAETLAHLANDPNLGPILHALAGQQLQTSQTVLTFGGDYAEGNIDKRQGVFISDGATVVGPVIGVNQGVCNYYM